LCFHCGADPTRREGPQPHGHESRRVEDPTWSTRHWTWKSSRSNGARGQAATARRARAHIAPVPSWPPTSNSPGRNSRLTPGPALAWAPDRLCPGRGSRGGRHATPGNATHAGSRDHGDRATREGRRILHLVVDLASLHVRVFHHHVGADSQLGHTLVLARGGLGAAPRVLDGVRRSCIHTCHPC